MNRDSEQLILLEVVGSLILIERAMVDLAAGHSTRFERMAAVREQIDNLTQAFQLVRESEGWPEATSDGER